MGRDKATLIWHGRTFAEHQAATLREVGCDPVVQIGGAPTMGLAVVPDRYPAQGPLGGVLTALTSTKARWMTIVACDTPQLRAATLIGLIDEIQRNDQVDVAVAHSGRLEPMCAVWRTDSVMERLERLWLSGVRSLHGALSSFNIVEVAVPAHELVNVNTPGDLVRAGNVPVMIDEVTVNELSELLTGGITLIDVRESDEYASGHAPGAVLVPLGSVLAGEATIAASGPVYMICRSGARSMRACETLAAQGVTAINVAGGTMAWVAAGFEVVEGMDPS
jgi:molybdopterin-guanine dinucleotide biosynthesis protein A/rhodanese-related sulfurtransferase